MGELLRQQFSSLCMTRFEDSLTLYTNDRGGWPFHLRHLPECALYAHNPQYVGQIEAAERFQFLCGTGLLVDADQTLPRDRAIRAAEEFFSTGELPQDVAWAEE